MVLNKPVVMPARKWWLLFLVGLFCSHHHLPTAAAFVSRQPLILTPTFSGTHLQQKQQQSRPLFPLGSLKRTQTNHPLSSSSTIPKVARKKWLKRGLLLAAAAGMAVLCFPSRSAASTALQSCAPMATATTAATTSSLPTAALTTLTTAVAPLPPPTMLPPVSRQTELRLTFRLFLAAILGGLVGKERSGAERHSAGVRTMSLVAMGAASFTICSSYGFGALGKSDPSRMASNVASGVGFIGAGVITTSSGREHSVVHGLTTAAAIWLSAAVGVSCGVGMYYLSTAASLLTIGVLRFGSISKRRYRRVGGRRKTAKTAATKRDPGHLYATTPTQDHGSQIQPFAQQQQQDDDEQQAEVTMTPPQYPYYYPYRYPYPPQQDPRAAQWAEQAQRNVPPEIEITESNPGVIGNIPGYNWPDQVVFQKRGGAKFCNGTDTTTAGP